LVSLEQDAEVNAKVADFGLAQIVEHSVGGGLGTFQWLAPEIIAHTTLPIYDERSDVYSFAMVMYELAARAIPFMEDYWERFCERSGRFDEMACIDAIVSDSLRPLVPDSAPERFARLMRRCWVHEPAARPKFAVIVNELSELLHSLDPKNATLKSTRSRRLRARAQNQRRFRAQQAAQLRSQQWQERAVRLNRFRLERLSTINLDKDVQWPLALLAVTCSSGGVPEDEIWCSTENRSLTAWHALRQDHLCTFPPSIHGGRRIYVLLWLTRLDVVLSLDVGGGAVVWHTTDKFPIGSTEVFSREQRQARSWNITCALDISPYRDLINASSNANSLLMLGAEMRERTADSSGGDPSSASTDKLSMSGSWINHRTSRQVDAARRSDSVGLLAAAPTSKKRRRFLARSRSSVNQQTLGEQAALDASAPPSSLTMPSTTRSATSAAGSAPTSSAATSSSSSDSEAEVWICDSSSTVMVCKLRLSGSIDEGDRQFDVLHNLVGDRSLDMRIACVKRIQINAPGTCMCAVNFTPHGADDKQLAYVWIGSVGITRIDMRTRRVVDSWPAHDDGGIRKLLHLTDVEQVWSCGDDGGIGVWGAVGGELVKILRQHTSPIRAIVALHRGQRVCTGSDDGTLVLWDVETYHPLQIMAASSVTHAGSIRCMAMSHNADVLWTGGGDLRLCLWREVLRNASAVGESSPPTVAAAATLAASASASRCAPSNNDADDDASSSSSDDDDDDDDDDATMALRRQLSVSLMPSSSSSPPSSTPVDQPAAAVLRPLSPLPTPTPSSSSSWAFVPAATSSENKQPNNWAFK
jgi:serine/threonine protein kinase